MFEDSGVGSKIYFVLLYGSGSFVNNGNFDNNPNAILSSPDVNTNTRVCNSCSGTGNCTACGGIGRYWVDSGLYTGVVLNL